MRMEESKINQQEKEALRKELNKKLGRKRFFKLGGCGSCLLIFFAVILIILGGAAWLLAQTGLVEVPFFSRFYHEPEPSRQVGFNGKGISFEDKLGEALAEQLLQNKKQLSESIPLEIILTEGELTYLLRQLASGGEQIKFTDSQIAVEPSGAELYTGVHLADKNLSTVITIYFIPQVAHGKIDLELKKVKLGNLPLPAVLGNLLVDSLLNKQLNNQTNFPWGEIIDINLRAGQIDISTEIKNPIAK